MFEISSKLLKIQVEIHVIVADNRILTRIWSELNYFWANDVTGHFPINNLFPINNTIN